MKGTSFHDEKFSDKTKESVWELSEGWYYIKNGEKEEIILPQKIVSKEKTFILYNESLTQKDAGLTITTKAAEYDLRMSYGNEVLYEYDDGGVPRNAQTKIQLNCDGVLPNILDNGKLKLEYFNTGEGVYNLPVVYIGEGSSITSSHLKESVFKVSITIIMLALSVFVFGVKFYLRKLHIYDKRFTDIALFLIGSSVWCLADSAIVQQNSYNYPIVCEISFYSFMLLAIPLLRFLKNTFPDNKDQKKRNIFDLLIFISYGNAIVQGILNYFGYFEFIEMLFVTHLILGVGSLIVAAELLKEYKKNKTEEIQTIVSAFLALAAIGVAAMILYWACEISYYSLIFEIGILVFIGFLLKEIIRTAVANFRAKTENEILRQVAKEDSLTGIGNRRAFEEYLLELQKEASTLKDALLIFIDINFLKLTNDHYGHNAGDELIIAAAGCIKKVFEEHGGFFRIGGDEFCVILKNPQKEETEWYRDLEKEVDCCNCHSPYKLSMAKGGSYLRDKDGKLKTISDWKYQADQNMYRDKSRHYWSRRTL